MGLFGFPFAEKNSQQIEWDIEVVVQEFRDRPAIATEMLSNDEHFDLIMAGTETLGDIELAWFQNPDRDGIDWNQNVVASEVGQGGSFHPTEPALELADLDSDGDMDIILGPSWRNGPLSWWENIDGWGTKWKMHLITAELSHFRDLVAVDIDGDNDLDIVVPALENVTENRVFVLFENESGGEQFIKHSIVPSFENYSSVNTADMDFDGDIDIVAYALDEGFSSLLWLENTGIAGESWRKHQIETELTNSCLATIVDFDADGDFDIVCGLPGENQVVLFENSCLP